ncbi:hypothetical protein ABW19_dt0209069 [Dactylella cylindrospora]|nr:hypothetical protein ABW19_dt0209069 [Dactylella cylindrospora]
MEIRTGMGRGTPGFPPPRDTQVDEQLEESEDPVPSIELNLPDGIIQEGYLLPRPARVDKLWRQSLANRIQRAKEPLVAVPKVYRSNIEGKPLGDEVAEPIFSSDQQADQHPQPLRPNRFPFGPPRVFTRHMYDITSLTGRKGGEGASDSLNQGAMVSLANPAINGQNIRNSKPVEGTPNVFGALQRRPLKFLPELKTTGHSSTDGATFSQPSPEFRISSDKNLLDVPTNRARIGSINLQNVMRPITPLSPTNMIMDNGRVIPIRTPETSPLGYPIIQWKKHSTSPAKTQQQEASAQDKLGFDPKVDNLPEIGDIGMVANINANVRLGSDNDIRRVTASKFGNLKLPPIGSTQMSAYPEIGQSRKGSTFAKTTVQTAKTATNDASNV